MFHPYPNQGGVATADPHVSGMNGQTRVPEIFGHAFPPNYAVMGQFPVAGFQNPMANCAYPAPNFQSFGYAAPFVNPMTPNAGWNPVASIGAQGWNTIPTVNPFVTTIPTPVNPNVPFGLPSVNPNGYCNPFINGYQPVVNAWNPYAAIPTYAGLPTPYVQTPFGSYPTPYGPVNPMVGYNPYLTQSPVLVPTPFGLVPMTPTPWAPSSFRPGLYNTPYTPSACGYPQTTPITGNPAIDSVILSSCSTPFGGITTTFGGLNPFAGYNSFYHPITQPVNPFTPFNPVNNFAPTSHITSAWNTSPWNNFNPLYNNPAYTGCGGWNNPWNSHYPWNNLQTHGFPWAAGAAFSPNAYGSTPFHANPSLAAATFNPLGGVNAPFFSPTNIAYGIPGTPVAGGFVNPLNAGTTTCGPVCCN